MNRAGHLVVCFALLALAGCKINVVVPQGGTVTTLSGNIECRAGQTCEVDASDATFTETFLANPKEGYEFTGWRKQQGWFCGGQQGDCALTTTFFAGNDDALAFLASDLTTYLEPVFECQEDADGNPLPVCEQVSKTLTGTVTDGPIPFAGVSVTLNGQTYSTTADANGFYTLEIVATNPDDMVKIVATGEDPETGTAVDFVHFPGSLDSIDAAEDQSVTNVTTANYVLAVEANGGVDPANQEQLKEAETAVDPDAVIELAGVIKLIVDDPDYALPQGYDNLLDFAADADAVESFVAEASGDLDGAVDDVLANPSLLDEFVAATIPARYYEIPAANPGYLARQGSALEFSQNGTGTLLDYNVVSGVPVNQSFTWAVNNGDLVVTYDQAVVSAGLVFDFGATSATREQIDLLVAEGEARGEFFPVFFDTITSSVTYTRISDGALVDQVRVSSVSVIDYEPIELFATTGETIQLTALEQADSYNSSLRDSSQVEVIPFEASCNDGLCATGTWGGSYRYAPGVDTSGQAFPTSAYGELINFSGNGSGSASGAVSGVAADWSVSNSQLVISYSDGWTQTLSAIDQQGIEYGIFSEFENGSERFATYSIFVKAPATFSFSESYLQNAAGKYWNGEINTWIPGAFVGGVRNDFNRFGWSFDASTSPLSGFNHDNALLFWDEDDVSDRVRFLTPLSWSVESDRVAIDRGNDIIRYWYPLASVVDGGERQIYVIELENRPGGLAFAPRINIQREINEFSDWDFIIE